MTNKTYALIPIGSLVVQDTIFASESFIASAPTEWTSQWAHIVPLVNDVVAGPGWVFDPGAGVFYPPADKPPLAVIATPPASYEQGLTQEGYTPDIVGLHTITADPVSTADVYWPETRLLQNVELVFADFQDPTFVDFQVVHPVSGAVLNQWGTNIPVPPDGTIKSAAHFDAAAEIPAGAVVRLRITGAPGARVYANYRTWVRR